MLQAKLCDGISHALGLLVVDRLRLALGHGAEAAAPRAEVAEHHEGSGLVVPALADVGAVGGLADSVQIELAGQLLQVVEGLAHRRTRLKPLGLGSGLAWSQVDLDERFGLEQRGHELIRL
jgi:hypothetical protein